MAALQFVFDGGSPSPLLPVQAPIAVYATRVRSEGSREIELLYNFKKLMKRL